MGILSKKQELRQEMKRRMTKRASMLRMFEKKGEMTTKDLMRHFGTGCSSRLFELRREGHIIVPQRIKPELYRYVYLGKREEDGTKVHEVD